MRKAAALVLGLGLLFIASPAQAHNAVDKRTPASGSTITQSPVAISISTDGKLLDLGGNSRGFGTALMDESGLYYGDGCVSVREHSIETSIDLGEPGRYSIVYQFVSADGHSLSESYEVIFAPLSDHTPAQGFSTPPECGLERSPEKLGDGTEISSPESPENSPATPIMETTEVSPWVSSASGTAIIITIVATLATTLLVTLWSRSRRN